MIMILCLFFGLTFAQQNQHDAIERQIATQVQRQREAIMDLWPHIDHKVAADFVKAQKCYVGFHLWKEKDCQDFLSKVDRDLSVPSDKQERGQ
jgi:hypothetical protein